MKKINYIYISKLDAAKRQLEIAIRLFMNNSDIVAIHTLTVAGHSILRDLSKKQGKESYMKDYMLKFVKPEHRKRCINKWNEAENFLKHADKDPNKLLEFITEQTEFLLWDSCFMYQNITNEHTPLILIYRMWFCTKNPDIFNDDYRKAILKSTINLKLDFNNRRQFLEYLPEATKLK